MINGLGEQSKNSFVLYRSYREKFKGLSQLAKGILWDAIMEYENGGVITIDDPIIALAFDVIKDDLDRNRIKYEQVVKKRREAGRKGGKQTQANQANACFDKQSQANQADSGNDNVSDSGNDINNYQSKIDNKVPAKSDGSDKRKPQIDYLIGLFEEKTGFKPIDTKPRFIAHNFYRKVSKIYKESRGEELADEAYQLLCDRFIDWYFQCYKDLSTQRLKTVVDKFDIFRAEAKKRKGAQ